MNFCKQGYLQHLQSLVTLYLYTFSNFAHGQIHFIIMIESNGYSNSLVPTTGGNIDGVGWEFSPEYHKRKTQANVYLNRHYLKKMNKLC